MKEFFKTLRRSWIIGAILLAATVGEVILGNIHYLWTLIPLCIFILTIYFNIKEK